MKNINFVNTTIICSVIFLCTLTAQAAPLPSDPNNAALLYYQAFMLLPEPDYFAKELVQQNTREKVYEYLNGGKLDPDPEKEIHEIEKSIHELELKMKGISPDPNKQLSPYERTIFTGKHFKEQRSIELDFLKESLNHHKKMKGVDPNKVIREYLRKCGKSIVLAQAASEIPDCDWGIRYSQGFSFLLPQMVEIKDLMRILRADAILLAADGHYRAALERCLIMRRIARHVGDDGNIQYAVSKNLDGSALKCIQRILGYMKPDIETLKWLNNRLSAESEASTSPARALEMDFELAVQSLRMDTDTLENFHQAMLIKNKIGALVKDESLQNDRNSKEKQSLTDEELLALAKKPYTDFLNSALHAMKSEMTYEEKYEKIKHLTNELKEEYDGGSAAFRQKILVHPEMMLTFSIVMACPEAVLSLYNLHVCNNSNFNALIAAIDIYLVKVKTGQLPEKLPDGLPKDPFSGEAFEYKITDEGFALRCKGRDINASRKKYSPDKPPTIVSDYFWKYEFKVKK